MEKTKYQLLSESLAEEAVQRTTKEQTKKPYDTTGFGYQFCVNRFNEIFEDKWGFQWKIMKEIEGTFRSGQPYYDITVSVGIWVENRENIRECVGGHIASIYADALKGAITNAFKKTASFWGVGRQAYEGTIDEDIAPQEEGIEDIVPLIPQKEIKNENHIEKSYRERLGDLMRETYKKDISGMQQKLLELTSFTNKEGKEIMGVTSLKELSDAQAKVAFYKFKKEIEEKKQKSEGKLFEEELQEEDRQRKIDSIKEHQQRLNKLKVNPFVIKQIFTSEGIKEGLDKANDEQLDKIKKLLEQLVEKKEKSFEKELKEETEKLPRIEDLFEEEENAN